MQTMKRVVSVAIGALVMASCSGDESSAPTTAALDVTTSVADTTPSTTTPPSTLAVTTTAATITLPATTTTVATEDLIKQAVQDYISSYFACGQTPATCDPSTFTANQGPSRATVTDLASGMNAQGLRFAPDLGGSYLVADSVSKESETEAMAFYCAYDAAVVLGPNGPDGIPTVVNNEVLSYRYRYLVFFEDAEWRVGEQRQEAILGEGNLCPPSA